ncbi:MAG TPA: YceI family protein [Opitutaceae bacterium]|jgi:polyisoprenoid-binding protein YceI
MKLPATVLALVALASGLTTAASAAVETYVIDPVHSSVGFKIRHFVSRVPGGFTRFSGTIKVDRDNLENSSVEAVIEVGSVSTRNENRDTDLRSPNYFDAAKFGTITFKSASWKKTGDNTFDVTGDLTIKGTTKPVTLAVTLDGFGPGMRGAQLSGWEATTTLNRLDFGVNGPAMLGKALGEDVAIAITVEADLKP